MLDFTNRQSYKWQAPDALVMQGWRSNHKRSSPVMAAPYFRSNYSEVKTQFEPPFDNCVCIPLTKGQHTIVDAGDLAKLIHLRWGTLSSGYAIVHIKNKTMSTHYLMHRIITDCPPEMQVDHINGNRLDNRLHNLRICTSKQNTQNYRARSRSKSAEHGGEFIGVWKNAQKWSARASVNNHNFHIGTYATAIEAAQAYDDFIIRERGEFAVLNFPAAPYRKTGV